MWRTPSWAEIEAAAPEKQSPKGETQNLNPAWTTGRRAYWICDKSNSSPAITSEVNLPFSSTQLCNS
jgi:hypothetical protein